MTEKLWKIENELAEQGFSTIVGVDEAGRGPLAGDVYAAAVLLPHGVIIDGLDDSKKLSEKTRERLFDEITDVATAYAISIAAVAEIAEHNILGATFLAMNRAIRDVVAQLAKNEVTDGFLALIDGNTTRGIVFPSRCVIGGDEKCASIAAASILAKVSRDRYMRQMDAIYPQYGFAKHKGYGTPLHRTAILEHGATPLHRELYLRKILAKAENETISE